MLDYEMMDNEHTFVPHHMRDGYKLWIERGILPGSFGTAVLTNNLAESFARADHINEMYIKSTVSWLYNYAPSDCWGSQDKVKKYADKFKGTE